MPHAKGFNPFLHPPTQLEFDENIVKCSLDWGNLLVTTPSKCYIYRYSTYSVNDNETTLNYMYITCAI